MSEIDISQILEEEAERAEQERDAERTYVRARPPGKRSNTDKLPWWMRTQAIFNVTVLLPVYIIFRLIPHRLLERLIRQKERTTWADAPLLSSEMLERYAGRWIAQQNGAVLFDADAPEQVVEALREAGEIATVWRVPSTKEEAEAHG